MFLYKYSSSGTIRPDEHTTLATSAAIAITQAMTRYRSNLFFPSFCNLTMSLPSITAVKDVKRNRINQAPLLRSLQDHWQETERFFWLIPFIRRTRRVRCHTRLWSYCARRHVCNKHETEELTGVERKVLEKVRFGE